VAHRDFEKVKSMLTQEPRLLATRASWDELAIEAAAHMGLFPMALWLAEQGAPISTCTAVLLGLRDRVKQALAEDPNAVRERGAHDFAILAFTMFAREQAEIADDLLKAGARVMTRTMGMTPLHMAASKGFVEAANVLLAHGADINLAVKSRG